MAATNGGGTGQPELNGIIQQDKEKQSVAVYSFDPDATPEQKAAAAGKKKDRISTSNLGSGSSSAPKGNGGSSAASSSTMSYSSLSPSALMFRPSSCSAASVEDDL